MDSGVRVVVLDNVGELAAYEAAWAALGADALEPNVFYEPCYLLPALRAFASPDDLVLALVLADPPVGAKKGAPPDMIGFFPLQRRRKGPRVGPLARKLSGVLSHFRLWADEYCYLAVPLVSRSRADEAMTAFFDWLATQKYAPPILEMNPLPLGGQFQAALIIELGRRRGEIYIQERDTRALFHPDIDVATYLSRVVPGKDRREIQRQRKRLQELGPSEIVALKPDDDVGAWAEQFMALEASGWKGKNGSAFACKEPDARFFREMFRAAFAAGRLSSTALRQGGKPIAIQLLLHSGVGAYGFKTAYDEAYARYGPGLLLEIDLMERAAGELKLRWIDSAAVRDHPVFNRIYSERRCLEHCFVTPSPGVGSLLSVAPALRWVKASLLAGAKRFSRARAQRGDPTASTTDATSAARPSVPSSGGS